MYYICTVQDLAGAVSLVLIFDISSNNCSTAPCGSPQSPWQLRQVPSQSFLFARDTDLVSLSILESPDSKSLWDFVVLFPFLQYPFCN